jgi:hypothetical protein
VGKRANSLEDLEGRGKIAAAWAAVFTSIAGASFAGSLPSAAGVVAAYLALAGLIAALLFAVQARDARLAAEDDARRRRELEEQRSLLDEARAAREAAREEARTARFERLVFETVYEAAHNLQHLASASAEGAQALKKELCRSDRHDTPQVWPRWPEFQTLQARALLTDDFEDLFEQSFPGGQLWSQVDHMLRNDGFLRRFSFDRQGLAHAEEFLAYFLEYCVRVLISGARGSDRARNYVKDGLTIEPLAELVAGTSDRWLIRFNASWAQEAVNENAPDAVDGTLALCWFDDRPPMSAGTPLLRDDIPSLEVKELGPAFRQLNDPPPRP